MIFILNAAIFDLEENYHFVIFRAYLYMSNIVYLQQNLKFKLLVNNLV